MKRPHIHVRRLLVFLFLLLIFAVPQATSAQVKTFYWERFDVDITLLENGDMRIVETQTLNFSGEPFTAGYGTIYTGHQGNNDGIVDISVREGDRVYQESSRNTPGTFEVSRNSNEVVIDWYFEPAIGRHTYTFSYTVKGGVILGADEPGSGDQIYWKAIPSDHPARIEHSTVTIRLPEGVRPQQYTGTDDYLVAAYINSSESPNVDIYVSEDGRTITYEAAFLATGQELEVRVQFPHGILNIPTPNWQRQQQMADVYSLIILAVTLLLLVGGPLLVLLLWYTAGRDPESGIVVPDYVSEPPDDLPPAVVGTLVDEKADMQDIVSTLVDLARRGYLTMEEEQRNHVFKRTEQSDADLRPFERQFLRDIFGGQPSRALSSLRYKFADKLPKLRQMLYEELVRDELVPRSPQSVRNSYGCLGGVVLAGAFGAFVLVPGITPPGVSTAVCPALAIALTGLALLFTAQHMPVKTRKGTETAARWGAFKEYLRNIERHQNLEEAGDIFEQYLGYAIAFGLERTWIRKFASSPTTPVPPWYIPYPHTTTGRGARRAGSSRGAGPVVVPAGGAQAPKTPTLEGMSGGLTGGLQSMSSGLTRMLNSTSTVLKSTPPSSSSGGRSGSFSGGFSGGSSGGGGSRGFR